MSVSADRPRPLFASVLLSLGAPAVQFVAAGPVLGAATREFTPAGDEIGTCPPRP